MGDMSCEELVVLQADLDDESPQVLGAVIGRMLSLGALDAHLCPLVMKKNRPGVRLEVLCRAELKDALVMAMLLETGTLGVKARTVLRYALARRMESVIVGGHAVGVKCAIHDGAVVRAVPEWDDCARVAEELLRPVRDVLDEARALARVFLP